MLMVLIQSKPIVRRRAGAQSSMVNADFEREQVAAGRYAPAPDAQAHSSALVSEMENSRRVD